MRSVLDITGNFLFIGYRIIMLPILVVLYGFFGLLATIRYTQMGLKMVQEIKFKPLQPVYQLFRYRLHFGRLLHARHLYKG
jgi:hypothetical protein